MIVIHNQTWDTARYSLWRRALRQMEQDYPGYNRDLFGGRLKAVTLDLDDGPARFLPDTAHGSIFVPLDLALEQPWRLVQETMIEGMIQQEVAQVLKITSEPARSAEYRRRCEEPRMQLALAMTRSPWGPLRADQERLLRAVQRLLTPPAAPGRRELAGALSQVRQRVLLQHSLAAPRAQREAAEPYGLRHLGRPLLLVSEGDRLLEGLLRDLCDVKVGWVPSFYVQRDRTGQVLEIGGTHLHLEVAERVYRYLHTAAVRLRPAPRQRPHDPLEESAQADRVAALLLAVSSTLKAQEELLQAEGQLRPADAGLERFWLQLHPPAPPLQAVHWARWSRARRAAPMPLTSPAAQPQPPPKSPRRPLQRG